MPDLSLVGARVDALVLAARVAVAPELAARVREAHELARELRAPVALELGPVTVAITPSRAVDRVHWASAEAHGILELSPRGQGRNLEVVVRQAALATLELEAALDLADRFLGSWGDAEDVVLRRVDLAADVAGWELRAEDHEAWLGPPRARGVAHLDLHDTCTCLGDRTARESPGWEHDTDCPLAGDPVRMRAWRRGAEVDGFMLCPGAPIVMRCYDKRRQLSVAGSDEMRSIEHARFEAANVPDAAPVARLEFQLRSEALTELAAREPRHLARKLDSLWQYLTQRWCRLIRPGTASRRRNCDPDARWQFARGVTFRHAAAPATRTRTRAGAQLRQALGCVRSWAARLGLLTYIRDRWTVVDADGEVHRGAAAARRMTGLEAAHTVTLLVQGLARCLMEAGPAALLATGEPHELAATLLEAHDGTVARFATVG